MASSDDTPGPRVVSLDEVRRRRSSPDAAVEHGRFRLQLDQRRQRREQVAFIAAISGLFFLLLMSLLWMGGPQ